MKNTGKCPKCDSTDVLLVRGWQGAYGAGNNIPIGLFRTAKVHRYICGSCGFTEEWIDAAKDMDRLRRRYGDENPPQE